MFIEFKRAKGNSTALQLEEIRILSRRYIPVVIAKDFDKVVWRIQFELL